MVDMAWFFEIESPEERDARHSRYEEFLCIDLPRVFPCRQSLSDESVVVEGVNMRSYDNILGPKRAGALQENPFYRVSFIKSSNGIEGYEVCPIFNGRVISSIFPHVKENVISHLSLEEVLMITRAVFRKSFGDFADEILKHRPGIDAN